MLREVVIDDQHVAALLHEPFPDARGRVRRDVLEAGRVVALGNDDNGVIQSVVLAQRVDNLRDGGRALADRTIDTEYILVALVDDCVDGKRGLARLAVAENQLPLAATNRDERVDEFTRFAAAL